MKGLFLWAMSQVPCLHEHLANAARVNTPPLGAHQIPCPAAGGGVIDSASDCVSEIFTKIIKNFIFSILFAYKYDIMFAQKETESTSDSMCVGGDAHSSLSA